MIDVRPLKLSGLLEIRPKRHGDDRGFFSETWNKETWARAGIKIDFVQDNHSRSERAGVIRGLHYQVAPLAQDKLVRVTRGAIFDVAVDCRRSSPTFGQWDAVVLSAEDWNQLLLPRGFAHGFLTLQPGCEVQYKVSAPYSRPHERAIRFDDPQLAIDWPGDAASFQLSGKDRAAPSLAEAELFE
jgi:dTDP-4-dehydrorhamnose 3,5-epimerase